MASWIESTDCDGTSSTIISSLSCSVDMNDLTSAPWSYTVDTLIVVRISAYNTYGWGLTSTPNTSGATARTVPSQMSAPTKGSDSSDT